MNPKIIQVDAFTNKPFSGNPAAVCVLDCARDDAWMQAVAAEMNLSETAFLLEQDSQFNLRWFTPTLEVDLCGHATLAAAHVVWEEKILKEKEAVTFHTKSGALTCVKKGGWIEMDFPAEVAQPAAQPDGLEKILGARVKWVGKNRMDYVVELESEKIVRALKPDLARMALIPARGFVVTARPGSREVDFVSRCFAPRAGIPEDPVTGSAHCALGPYWGAKLNKTEMTGWQASARGGAVRVVLRGDRVTLAGQAVTVLRGTMA